jgi:hypothetical protein
MRHRLALLVCALTVTGCGSHDRTAELQQQKITLDLMKAQNEQLAALTKTQNERLTVLTEKEKTLRALEKDNQETLREIEQERASLKEVRKRARQDEAAARGYASPQNTKMQDVIGEWVAHRPTNGPSGGDITLVFAQLGRVVMTAQADEEASDGKYTFTQQDGSFKMTLTGSFGRGNMEERTFTGYMLSADRMVIKSPVGKSIVFSRKRK